MPAKKHEYAKEEPLVKESENLQECVRNASLYNCSKMEGEMACIPEVLRDSTDGDSTPEVNLKQEQTMCRDLKVSTMAKPGSEILNNVNAHKCYLCQNTFSDESMLYTHTCIPVKETQVNEKEYFCDVCLLKYKSEMRLNKHKLRHHSDVYSYLCKICKMPFKSEMSLNAHNAQMHPNEQKADVNISDVEKLIQPFLCGICEVQFEREYDLEQHILVHAKARKNTGDVQEKSFLCNICKKRFKRKCDWSKHIKRHTNSTDKKGVTCLGDMDTHNPLPCKPCQMQFKNKSSLNKHLLVHKTEKKYVCTVCSKRYKYLRTLNKHMNTHLKQNSCENFSDHATQLFSCDTCKKQFKLKHNLIIHLKIHAGTKPYSCDTCKMSFACRSALYKHHLTHTKHYTCDICNHRCARKCSIEHHIVTHMLLHYCSVCKTQYVDKKSLVDHKLMIHGKEAI